MLQRMTFGSIALVCGMTAALGAAEPTPLVPFVLPWDDASPGVTDVSHLIPKPAGKAGPVGVSADGHFATGGERIRFFGVNLCFGGNFPTHEEADKIAARMARFGINVVRFHHMDNQVFPTGIRSRTSKVTSDLDPEALDRLGYLIAALKKHGIYSNLNLLVSRPLSASDGLPPEIESIPWKERAVAGFFHEPAIESQKRYAKNLLGYRNPYTGLTFADDPAVAFVEIHNEAGLIHGWLGKQVDDLPESLRAELARRWNAWLKTKYGSTAKLRSAWGIQESKPGAELLGEPMGSGSRWNLEKHGQAAASLGAETAPPEARAAKAVKIAVAKPSDQSWHVQFSHGGLKVQGDQSYSLAFWARAEKNLKISINLSMAHDPWENLGFRKEITLTPQWKFHRFVFQPMASDDNARISISDLARQAGTISLAGLSFKPGGTVGLEPTESVERGSIRFPMQTALHDRTAEAERDFFRFLWEIEDAYWQGMRTYLKNDLGVKGVVFGTIVGCSTPVLQARLEAIDTHAYWKHPHFPGRPWDPNNWTVENKSMVNDNGGTLPQLALRRVFGKPHCVTEYNHSAPNTYGSEGFLILAAYASLQDWDALYVFAYSHNNRWNSRMMQSYFDIDQNPTKMATLPAAAALFYRADVQPAKSRTALPINPAIEVEGLRGSHSWNLVHAGTLGMPAVETLKHRVGLTLDESATWKAPPAKKPAPTTEQRFVADTGELTWDRGDPKRGLILVDTPRSKAVIGFGQGKSFDLSGVTFEPGATRLDGWSTVSWTVIEGKTDSGPARILVTATGLLENEGLKWTSPERNSVGRNWGSPPSKVEVVPVKITLPRERSAVRAWALDERGQRQGEVSVRSKGPGQSVLELGAPHATIWYEIELK